MAISIFAEFAGGGIILAFLLPRVIERFQLLLQHSTHSRNSDKTKTKPTAGTGSDSESGSHKRDGNYTTAKGPYRSKNQKQKSAKRDVSRTPPEVLQQRLEQPQKMEWKEEYFRGDRDANDNVQSVSYAISTHLPLKPRGPVLPTHGEVEMETVVQEENPLDASLDYPTRAITSKEMASNSPSSVKPLDGRGSESHISEKTPLTSARKQLLPDTNKNPKFPLKQLLRDFVIRTHSDLGMEQQEQNQHIELQDLQNASTRPLPIPRSISSDDMNLSYRQLQQTSPRSAISLSSQPNQQQTGTTGTNVGSPSSHSQFSQTKKEKSDDDMMRHLSSDKSSSPSQEVLKKNNLIQKFHSEFEKDKKQTQEQGQLKNSNSNENNERKQGSKSTNEEALKARPLAETPRGRSADTQGKNSKSTDQRMIQAQDSIEPLPASRVVSTGSGIQRGSHIKVDEWHTNPLMGLKIPNYPPPYPPSPRSFSPTTGDNVSQSKPNDWSVY